MALRQRRTRGQPLLPLLNPSPDSDSPHCRSQPAPLPNTSARSRSPLPRLRRLRSPTACHQRSAIAERAAIRLAEEQAAQEVVRLAARVAARDHATDAAWLAARRADRFAASMARKSSSHCVVEGPQTSVRTELQVPEPQPLTKTHSWVPCFGFGLPRLNNQRCRCTLGV